MPKGNPWELDTPTLPIFHLGVLSIAGRLYNVYSDGSTLPVVAGGSVDELDELPLLLKPSQAAEQLQISRTALFQLLADGELESILINQRSRRIPRTALADYVARLRDGAR